MTPSPEPLEARLDRLESKLDRLLGALDRLQFPLSLAEVAEDYVAIGGDVFDEWATQQAAQGVDLDARMRAAYRTLMAVSDPRILDAVQQLAALAPKLTYAAGLAAVTEDYVAIGGDVADEWARTAMEQGVDLEQLLREAGPTALGAARLLADGTARRSVEILGSDLVGKVLAATADAASSPAPKVGVLGLVTALSDPKVQRAAGFLVAFARHLGARLETPGLVRR